MTHAIDLLVTIILALAGLVMEVIGAIDGLLAALMTSAGIPPQVQLILLIAMALVLVIAAIRLLGGIFAGLIVVLLVLLVVHQLLPGMEVPNFHQPGWLHLPNAMKPASV